MCVQLHFFKQVSPFNSLLQEEPPPSPPRPYNFNYQVHDKEQYNDYQREENSDGQYISGSYRVNLPDGRIQTVSYKAGPGGISQIVFIFGEQPE